MAYGYKYIFEGKKPLWEIWLWRLSAAVIAALLVFSLFCIYLPLHAKKKNQQADEIFYQKSADLIVVFTGDAGRISYAIQKAKESPKTRVLISGVYAANTLKNILDKEDLTELQAQQIEIDYLARNTIENVFYTLRHLSELRFIKKVLVISSDYHLARIQLLFSKMEPNYSTDNQVEFYFQGTPTDYGQWRNIKILALEVLKLFNTTLYLWGWENDIPEAK